jgi:hypothetical protein
MPLPIADALIEYRKLGPLPAYPGQRSYVDRCRTEEMFVANGPLMATLFRDQIADTGRDCVYRYLRGDCPALFDLILRAF